MAKFKSIFHNLGFYVKDKLHRFVNGEFETKSKEVIKVLESIPGVERVDQPEEKPAQEAPKAEQPKEEAKAAQDESKPEDKKTT